MKIISVINLKGGVAKDHNRRFYWLNCWQRGTGGENGKGSRVLLFDNDKQGNTSRMFGVYNGEREAEACRIIKTGRITREYSGHERRKSGYCTV